MAEEQTVAIEQKVSFSTRFALSRKKYVGDGWHSKIYKIDDETVARVFIEHQSFLNDLPCEVNARHEFDLGIFLHSQGVSVPKMHQLIAPDSGIRRHFPLSIDNWVILMEYFRGEYILPSCLPKSELEIAMAKRDAEIEKVRGLGYAPDDSDKSMNTLYDRKSKRVCLLDLVYWHKK